MVSYERWYSSVNCSMVTPLRNLSFISWFRFSKKSRYPVDSPQSFFCCCYMIFNIEIVPGYYFLYSMVRLLKQYYLFNMWLNLLFTKIIISIHIYNTSNKKNDAIYLNGPKNEFHWLLFHFFFVTLKIKWRHKYFYTHPKKANNKQYILWAIISTP